MLRGPGAPQSWGTSCTSEQGADAPPSSEGAAGRRASGQPLEFPSAVVSADVPAKVRFFSRSAANDVNGQRQHGNTRNQQGVRERKKQAVMATDNVAVELRDALTKNAKRVVDLFREWDEDGDGNVSKKEFRKAIPLIVQDVPKAAVDQLFDDWDPDKSGMISLAELIKKLRR